ncbi:MAG TPA: ACT domain-containing protein [Firmicutes bacterium]|uniref:ACT domain-containing protein n=1 Tax=Capillibacterium thermochitinicola TaxID=2699427 RepID=A0A8J6I1N2_9FIRM|nr:ACT domain-containing protein [Capillibacterium thermochitinicola]MBA2133059.1 ACT domain-containing protein [Capillibacterium thermochitinicola]HHW13042.1 ACT domain-containing protein [Bacillota bacterium]
MKVKQISVFLENKSGRLAQVTKILGANRINIRALAIADTADYGILRLIVNDPGKALAVLRAEGLTVRETEVIAVEVPDQPGGLAAVLQELDAKGINIEYMYAFVGKTAENAIVIFRVEEIDRALELLENSQVKLLPERELYHY